MVAADADAGRSLLLWPLCVVLFLPFTERSFSAVAASQESADAGRLLRRVVFLLLKELLRFLFLEDPARRPVFLLVILFFELVAEEPSNSFLFLPCELRMWGTLGAPRDGFSLPIFRFPSFLLRSRIVPPPPDPCRMPGRLIREPVLVVLLLLDP